MAYSAYTWNNGKQPKDKLIGMSKNYQPAGKTRERNLKGLLNNSTTDYSYGILNSPIILEQVRQLPSSCREQDTVKTELKRMTYNMAKSGF
jgi:hypothetical protein